MKYRTFYISSIIMSSSFLVNHMGYGSDQGQTSSLKSRDVIKQAITKQEEQGDVDIGKRTKKRAQGRELQKKAALIEKKIKTATEPMHDVGMAASTLAYASGDPHARLAAMALNITIYAVDGLGRGIARIVTGVGRYQERIQDILSNIEVLIEDLQKASDKMKDLNKKKKELLDVGKLPEPSQSSSTLKKMGQNALNLAKNAQNKVRDATDVLTNDKAKREEKLKAIQVDLKVQEDNYAEILKILQIKLLQDAVKELDKKIDIDQTISNLEEDVQFYKNSKEEVSQKKSKQKKQLEEIQKAEARVNRELVFYMKIKNSPSETEEELQDQRSTLVDKIQELTQLTKMGESIYLQQKDIQLDSQLNRSAIVSILKEIDDIKDQLKQLAASQSSTTTQSLKKDIPSEAKALPTTSQKQTRSSGTFSQDMIQAQRESLRKTPTRTNQ